MSSERQKFYFLIQSNLSVCSFIDGGFDVVSKEYLPNPRSQDFSLMIPSLSFVTVGFDHVCYVTYTLNP